MMRITIILAALALAPGCVATPPDVPGLSAGENGEEGSTAVDGSGSAATSDGPVPVTSDGSTSSSSTQSSTSGDSGDQTDSAASSESTGGTTGTPAVCEPAEADTACAGCVKSQCCDELEVCVADIACGCVVDCVLENGLDLQSVAMCSQIVCALTMVPPGAAPVQVCVSVNCTTECGV